MAKIVKLNHKTSEDLIYQIMMIKPGEFSCPYHFHHTSEEIFVILEGGLTLRSPDGFRELNNGDVVFFEKGKRGAHQLYNNTDKNCVYLDIGSNKAVDVCEYPDNSKIGINSSSGFELFRKGDTASYYQGEDYESTKRTWIKQGFKFK